MATLSEINDDDTLKIVNTFEPVPLLNKLKTQGYTHKTERPENGEVHTYITKVSNHTNIESDNSDTENSQSFYYHVRQDSVINAKIHLDSTFRPSLKILEISEDYILLESIPKNGNKEVKQMKFHKSGS